MRQKLCFYDVQNYEKGKYNSKNLATKAAENLPIKDLTLSRIHTEEHADILNETSLHDVVTITFAPIPY